MVSWQGQKATDMGTAYQRLMTRADQFPPRNPATTQRLGTMTRQAGVLLGT